MTAYGILGGGVILAAAAATGGITTSTSLLASFAGPGLLGRKLCFFSWLSIVFTFRSVRCWSCCSDGHTGDVYYTILPGTFWTMLPGSIFCPYCYCLPIKMLNYTEV